MAEEKITYTPPELAEKEVPYPYGGFYKIRVYTHRIYGCCPISVEGDEWVFDSILRFAESKISYYLPNFFDPEHPNAMCTIALHSLDQYIRAMAYGVSAVDLGIAISGKNGYVMCPSWEPPTCEAAVIYRLHPEPIEKRFVERYYEHLAKVGHTSVPTFYFEKFASPGAKLRREQQIEEWIKVGKPKFWEGWRHQPCQPSHEHQ